MYIVFSGAHWFGLWFLGLCFVRELVAFCCVACAASCWCLTVLSVCFHCLAGVVQLLCSLSGWLHLNCSSIGTGFNGAETNCRIAHSLGILLMNSNCFVIYFRRHVQFMSVHISIYEYNLGFVRWWMAILEQVPDTYLYGWCKLFPLGILLQTY